MLAFKSRLSATLDFPRFKEAAYLEAAVCFEDGLDVVGSADEFPTADANNGPDIEEAAAEADDPRQTALPGRQMPCRSPRQNATGPICPESSR